MRNKTVRHLRNFIREPAEGVRKARETTSRRKGLLVTTSFSPGRLKRCHGAAALAFQRGAPSTRALSADRKPNAGTQTAESAACSERTTSSAPTGDTPDFTSRSFSWSGEPGVRKTALFRLYSRGALLQHVRTIRVQQRGGASKAEIDPEAALEDVPKWVRDELRSDGYPLAAGGVA